MPEETYRAAIAAAIALEPGDGRIAIVGAEVVDSITKAETVCPAWVVEIPHVGEMLEKLAKRADVTVFYLDEVPGSLFATTEKLVPGASSVLVAGGNIGTRAAFVATPAEKSANTISKLLKTAEERYVLGVVLVPEQADSQGDIYSHAEVRKAAHDYMENAGGLGRQHTEIVTGKLRILESYIAPAEFQEDGETVTKGTWLMGIRVVDDDLWTGIKKGEYTGFSIGGEAFRNPELA